MFKSAPAIIPHVDDEEERGDEFAPLTPTSRRYKNHKKSVDNKPEKAFDFSSPSEGHLNTLPNVAMPLDSVNMRLNELERQQNMWSTRRSLVSTWSWQYGPLRPGPPAGPRAGGCWLAS